jgi:hypothetical protein
VLCEDSWCCECRWINIAVFISCIGAQLRGDSVKIDNSSIERVEEFKYLGTTLTDQNSI